MPSGPIVDVGRSLAPCRRGRLGAVGSKCERRIAFGNRTAHIALTIQRNADRRRWFFGWATSPALPVGSLTLLRGSGQK